MTRYQPSRDWIVKLGKKLTRERKRKGLTRIAVAARIGVSQEFLARWEQGHQPPPLRAFLAISELFEVSCDWLLGRRRYTGGPILVKPPPEVKRSSEPERPLTDIMGSDEPLSVEVEEKPKPWKPSRG
jgi:transcriptional regulator with XRE-family HTH domain